MVYIIGRNCDKAQMSCEVAKLPFQANANNGTWSIDFDQSMTLKKI